MRPPGSLREEFLRDLRVLLGRDFWTGFRTWVEDSILAGLENLEERVSADEYPDFRTGPAGNEQDSTER